MTTTTTTSTTTTTTTATPLAMTTTSVPAGTTGTAYSATLAASGGTPAYNWSVTSGALPPGLTLSTSGAISGTPTTSGSYSFVAQVKDSASGVATYTYSMSIAAGTPTTPPLAISTASVPGGTAGTAYASTTLAATGGSGSYTWSVASGSTLPPGLSLSPAGVVSGTPTTAATYSFSIQTKDSANTTATQAYSMTVAAAPTTTTTTATAPCSSIYGNCGDAYEGKGGPPSTATAVSACGSLSPTGGQYYLLTANIGSSAGANCLVINWAGNFTLDLGGHTVTGVIAVQTNSLSGTVVFHGTVTCAVGSGCINIQGSDVPSAQARLHHLTVNQSAFDGYSVYVAWQPAATGTPVPGFKVDHIDGAYPGGQPSSVRNYFLLFSGPFVGLEAAYNNLVLPTDAAACQGIVAYEAPGSSIHNNYIVMGSPMNVSSGMDTCRGILFDSEGKVGVAGTGGGSSAYNNIIYAGQNRAVRVRGELNDSIYNNTLYNCQIGGVEACIMIGDTDLPSEPTSAQIFGNSIELNGGAGVVVGGSNLQSANVYNNTVTCRLGSCSSGTYFAMTQISEPGYPVPTLGPVLTVKNNTLPAGFGNAVLACGPPGNAAYTCVTTADTSSVTYCNTGNVVGNGTITQQCP